jgi:hypothetical protein
VTLRILRVLFVTALLAAFAMFVWPTRWRYDHMTVGDDTYPVRIDRISGHADILLPGEGWTPAEEASDMDPDGQEQPQGNRI